MRSILYSAFVLLLAGCASVTSNYYTQTVESWRGGNVDNLIKSWGRPDTKVVSPNGNMFLVYRTESYRSYNAPSTPEVGVHFTGKGAPVLVSGPNPGAASNWTRGGGSITCYTGFEANSKGVIIKTQVEGAGCYSGEAFANQKRNQS